MPYGTGDLTSTGLKLNLKKLSSIKVGIAEMIIEQIIQSEETSKRPGINFQLVKN